MMTGARWKLLLQIFTSFVKIGPITFGGGYAMIPLIEREIVQRRGWIAERDWHDIIAVSGAVPGAIAINCATFVGFRLAGLIGALAATIGVMLPTFAIVLMLGVFFMTWQHSPLIEAAFTSIRATIIALIAYAAYKFGKFAIVDKTTLVIVPITAVLLAIAGVHPILLIIGGFIGGIVLVIVREKLGLTTNLGREDTEQSRSPDYFMGDGI